MRTYKDRSWCTAYRECQNSVYHGGVCEAGATLDVIFAAEHAKLPLSMFDGRELECYQPLKNGENE